MRLNMAQIGFAFLLMGSSPVLYAQSVDLREVERDWQSLEQACRRRVIRFKLTNPPTSSGKLILPQSGRCLVDGPSGWLSAQSSTAAPPQKDEVFGMHRDYAFQLLRRTPDSPYLLKSLDKQDAPPFLKRWQQRMSLSFCCDLPWGGVDKPLRVWLKEPGFQLKSSRREVEAGIPLVVLECTYSPPNGQHNFYFTRTTIKLDPSNRHRFHSVQGEFNLGTFSGKAEYAENDRDRPVPIRYTTTQEVKGSKAVWVCEYHEWKYPDQPIPENELGLTAFGIPEPAWSKPLPRSRSWIWISASLVGSVALAAMFIRLRRRDPGRVFK